MTFCIFIFWIHFQTKCVRTLPKNELLKTFPLFFLSFILKKNYDEGSGTGEVVGETIEWKVAEKGVSGKEMERRTKERKGPDRREKGESKRTGHEYKKEISYLTNWGVFYGLSPFSGLFKTKIYLGL